jgi:signal transduction histidine kinase
MDFRRLKWLAILAPVLFIGVLEYARQVLGPAIQSWQGRLLMDGVILLCGLFFFGAAFTVIRQMQEKLERRNRELAALREAGLDVTSDLSLDKVLRKVVELARNLIGTRYGALSVIDEAGKIRTFVTTGVTQGQVEKIGSPPVGKGILGVVLREGQHLRIADIGGDARSRGFPEHHPEMRTLLAVPVVCRGPFKGNLYLSERLDGGEFTAEEEETLVRFASQAAIAVDNAHLHLQVGSLAVADEHLRIAHELHDGQAQVLAYVNTKVQAVQEFLRRGQIEKAADQLEQLAAAAREVYADVREGILGLRAAANAEHGFVEALRHHLETWQDQCGIKTELSLASDAPHLTPDVELQLLRITQEALANVRKHSEARRVEVRLDNASTGLRIMVIDDGKGFEIDAAGRPVGRPRFGLSTMRERAEAIGARFEIESGLGEGTRIQVEYAPRRN